MSISIREDNFFEINPSHQTNAHSTRSRTMNFEPLCRKIDYFFKNYQLLRQACTHKSFVNEQSLGGNEDNERLEFLGDAVLDLLISDLLMDHFPDLSEGGLTKLRASLVSETGLSKIAHSIDLGAYLLLGRGEELTGGRQKKSILSSSLEAVIAAIYTDTRQEGLLPVQKVVHKLFKKEIPRTVDSYLLHDDKTDLQEFVQKNFKATVVYNLLNTFGPEHQKEFEVVATIDEKELGRGRGSSKKQAEQRAAREALFALTEDEDFFTSEEIEE